MSHLRKTLEMIKFEHSVFALPFALTGALLAARYAAALADWNGEVTEEFRRKLRALRGLCQDIVELRRGDHSGAR